MSVDIVAKASPVEPQDGEGERDEAHGDGDPECEPVPILHRLPLERWKFPLTRHSGR